MPLLTVLMLSGSPMAAEYAEILPIETLLLEADEAVQGVVSQATPEWGEDGLIYTRVELNASNSLLKWRKKAD